MILLLQLTVLVLLQRSILSLSISAPRTKVIVVGASRSVGLEVFKKLLKNKKTFEVVGVVRSQRGIGILKGLGASDAQIKVADITDKESIRASLKGADKVIVCTSSKPRRTLFAFIKLFLSKLLRRDIKLKPTDMYYRENESPYVMDYVGARNCIDAAVAENCQHFVLLSCMGGYRQPELNEIGRSFDDEEKIGNVWKWKRASERYLMKRLFFTIVHSGKLSNDSGGKDEIVWDTDDALLRTGIRKISRVRDSRYFLCVCVNDNNFKLEIGGCCRGPLPNSFVERVYRAVD
jgi:hypothetical protein